MLAQTSNLNAKVGQLVRRNPELLNVVLFLRKLVVFWKEERAPRILGWTFDAIKLFLRLRNVFVDREDGGSGNFECPQADNPSPVEVLVLRMVGGDGQCVLGPAGSEQRLVLLRNVQEASVKSVVVL